MKNSYLRIGGTHTFTSKPTRVDLRNDYDDFASVIGGKVYRRGNIVQVWWKDTGVETWHAPDEGQAKDNYSDMVERWSIPIN